MIDPPPDGHGHVLRFNPSAHERPWVALDRALDARGGAHVVVIDGAIDGPQGRINTHTADAHARERVVDELATPALLSLLVLRGPTVHLDDAMALALACDLRWASPGATWQSQALALGELPFASVTDAAVDRLGTSRALGLALREIPTTSAHALGWGLIDEVVADHEVDARIAALITRTATFPRDLLAETKALLRPRARGTAQRRESDARRRLDAAPDPTL